MRALLSGLSAQGLDVWNACLEREVKIHVHYVLVDADMPERRALMCSSGHQGKSFCEYCRQYSVRGTNGGMYCPHLPPHDAPSDITKRESAFKEKGVPHYPFTDVSALPAGARRVRYW